MGCAVIDGAIPASLDDAFNGEGVTVEVLNVLGAGDAFSAGFLSGWVRGEDYDRCARYANACGALVVSRHGCAPAMPTRVELDYFLANAAVDPAARPGRDADAPASRDGTAHAARRGLRVRVRSSQPVLRARAAGGRRRGAPAGAEAAAGRGRRRDRSGAGARAASVGVLCDDRYGQDALNAATGRGWWIGRPVELPGSNPLQFDRGRSVGTTLLSWPAEHVVKCLVALPPRRPDRASARAGSAGPRAVRRGRRRAATSCCSRSFRRQHLPRDDDTVLRSLKRLYNLGIYPEWWKLEPMSPAQWQAVDALIAERDPYCRGVVLLGLNASVDTLADGLPRRAREPHRAAASPSGARSSRSRRSAWLAGAIDDAELKRQVRANFEALIAVWRPRAERGERCAMKTLHRTAQALVRYLAALRAQTPEGVRAALRRRVRDLRPRQRRRHGRGAVPPSRASCRPTARTTSRRWRTRPSPTPRRTSAGA